MTMTNGHLTTAQAAVTPPPAGSRPGARRRLKPGGQNANTSGQKLVRQTRDALLAVLPDMTDLGSTAASSQAFDKLVAEHAPTPALVAEYLGLVDEDYYHSQNHRVDLVLYHPELWPQRLALQLKRQYSTGSADEKLVSAVRNAALYPCDAAFIVDAPGARPGVLRRMHEDAQEVKQIVGIFSSAEEFGQWVHHQLAAASA